MNIPNKFDLYLENKLSGSEKNQFERELSEQPELAKSYKAYYQINYMLRNELSSPLLKNDDDPILNELSISQKLSIDEDFNRFYKRETENESEESTLFVQAEITSQNFSDSLHFDKSKARNIKDEAKFIQILNKAANINSRGKFKIVKLFIAIAAVFAIAFFAGKTIFEQYFTLNKKISPQEAFANYYNPNSDKELNSLNFNDSKLKTLFPEFRSSEINSSSIISNRMNVSDEDYEISLLYLGIICIERNELLEARTCFNRIISLENAKKICAADFYLSLTYLSEGKYAKARPFLIQLSETGNPYQKKAKAILRSVKP